MPHHPKSTRFSGSPIGTSVATADPSSSSGRCRPSTLFNGKKAEIVALHEGFEILEEDRREEMLKFYEDFCEMMDTEQKFDSQILRNCKNW